MERNKNWFRFILSGRVEDYIRYSDSCKQDKLLGGEDNSFFNRCIGDKGEQYRGERPPRNTYDS